MAATARVLLWIPVGQIPWGVLGNLKISTVSHCILRHFTTRIRHRGVPSADIGLRMFVAPSRWTHEATTLWFSHSWQNVHVQKTHSDKNVHRTRFPTFQTFPTNHMIYPPWNHYNRLAPFWPLSVHMAIHWRCFGDMDRCNRCNRCNH